MFKVGDRVNLCNPSSPPKWKYKGAVGEIINTGVKIRVRWDTNDCIFCGSGCSDNLRLRTWSYWPEEIKLVLKKGEQLLFEFML